MIMKYLLFSGLLLFSVFQLIGQSNAILEGAEDHYVDNDGVKIHYVTKGDGETILFVHGFPDFWYSWRDQMVAMSEDHQVVSIDLRGYNRSDSPKGVEHYSMDKLVSDLVAVINDLGTSPVKLVAHDWGAAIAWILASYRPDLIKKLVILSVGHPKAGLQQPIDTTKTTYVDYFLSDQFMQSLTGTWFSGWVNDADARTHYKEAFERSDKEAMINYYRANSSTNENLRNEKFVNRYKNLPNLKMPVLVVHGKKDQYLPLDGHAYTWNFVDNEFSMHVFNEAAHFIQQDKSEELTILLKTFLNN